MFKFEREQMVFDIAGIKVGGQPGENPPVLIGSIFYHGHKIVIDANTGNFHKEEAEKLVALQEEFSAKTGIPCMLDVVASTKEAMERFIGFVADVTRSPFLIDAPTLEAKVAGVKYANEIGVRERVIYNSLTPESKLDEFSILKENNVESAILLAYKGGVVSSRTRVKMLKDLLCKAEEAGVSKPLLDTFVIDIPSLSLACKALLDLKRELGLPCGCGAHNAIATWVGLKERLGAHAIKPCVVTVNVAPIILGADFLLYGPIEDCKYIFPAVYTIHTAYKYLKKVGEQLKF